MLRQSGIQACVLSPQLVSRRSKCKTAAYTGRCLSLPDPPSYKGVASAPSPKRGDAGCVARASLGHMIMRTLLLCMQLTVAAPHPHTLEGLRLLVENENARLAHPCQAHEPTALSDHPICENLPSPSQIITDHQFAQLPQFAMTWASSYEGLGDRVRLSALYVLTRLVPVDGVEPACWAHASEWHTSEDTHTHYSPAIRRHGMCGSRIRCGHKHYDSQMSQNIVCSAQISVTQDVQRTHAQ